MKAEDCQVGQLVVHGFLGRGTVKQVYDVTGRDDVPSYRTVKIQWDTAPNIAVYDERWFFTYGARIALLPPETVTRPA